MPQTFTAIEIRLIVLVVILSFIRGMYNLTTAYVHRNEGHGKKGGKFIETLIRKDYGVNFFNLVQFAISSIYLFLSIYFFVTDKIKTKLFSWVCLFMLVRSLLYFYVRFYLPEINDLEHLEDKYVNYQFLYYNFLFANSVMLFVGGYFIKTIFF